jgi:hypothetical protein
MKPRRHEEHESEEARGACCVVRRASSLCTFNSAFFSSFVLFVSSWFNFLARASSQKKHSQPEKSVDSIFTDP